MERLTTIVGKDSCVTGDEIKGAGVGIADEDGSAALASVEVKPFLCLFRREKLRLATK